MIWDAIDEWLDQEAGPESVALALLLVVNGILWGLVLT